MPAPTSNPMPENIDYSSTSNVVRLHAAVAREKGDPVTDAAPVPLAIIAVVMAFSLLAGGYWSGNTGTDLSAANIKGYAYVPEFRGVPPLGGGEMTPLELHQPANWIA